MYGADAQRSLQNANVLLVGLRGLGVEIAKNVILSGVKSVGLLDPGKVEIADLGSQFYLKESDVGKPRDECSVAQLAELNKYVNVHRVPTKAGCRLPYLDDTVLKNYSVLVLTDKTIAEQAAVNDICRRLGIKFIAANVQGLFASVFVDLIEHTVRDTNGEREKRGMLSAVSPGEDGKSWVFTTADKRLHGLQTGDFVSFSEVKGMAALNGIEPVRVKSKSGTEFIVEKDISQYGEYKGDGYYEQVKVPKTFTFEPLSAQLKKPKIETYDWMEMQCHCLSYGLSAFEQKNRRLPDPTKPADAEQVVAAAVAFAEANKLPEIEEKMQAKLRRLATVARAQIAPMTATMGGIVGQEIIKACTSKFTPIQQFLYYNALSALPEDAKAGPDRAPIGCRYDDYYAVFGRAVADRVRDMKMFLIGSGAIGCEMLKNWALMGLSTGERGGITITDMDTIEKSNLSRQFLFRNRDIGKMKATCATAAARAMNPKLKIRTDSIRVGKETENVYDTAFWESLDGATTALDNMQARLYVDARCVEFQKPMVDSGTLGTKGNTQVMMPSLTEAYGEGAADPPAEGIPVCTLKSFPHKIEHTIQWARDKFEGWFTNGPREAKSYIDDEGYLKALAQEPTTQLGNLETLNALLVKDRPSNFQDCVKWARLKFQELYSNDIVQLLTVYPEGKTNDKGVPFWSGTKRRPDALEFSAEGEGHMDFIVAAANLYAGVYGIEGTTDAKAIAAAVGNVSVPKFVPDKNKKIAATEEEAKEEAKEAKEGAGEDVMQKISRLEKSLPERKSIASVKISPAKFEKDDPTNFHIDFVTACSNLRALNYRIKRESKHQTKFIAGKITPAIATTTAMVTGMVCIEWYKIVQNFGIETYRNSYANLALPLFTAAEPFPPAKKEVKLQGERKGETLAFSSWDHIKIRASEDVKDPSMKAFLRYWFRVYGFRASTLSCGVTNLYMSARKKDKVMRRLLKLPLADVVRERSGEDLPSKQSYLVLNLFCDNPEADENASDAEKTLSFPPIRYYY